MTETEWSVVMERETYEWSIPGPPPSRSRFDAALARAASASLVGGATSGGLALDFSEVRGTAAGLEGALRVLSRGHEWGRVRLAPVAPSGPARYEVTPVVLAVPWFEDGEEYEGEKEVLTRHELCAGLNRRTLIFGSSDLRELLEVRRALRPNHLVTQVSLDEASTGVAWQALHLAFDGTVWAAGTPRSEGPSRIAHGLMSQPWSSLPLVGPGGDWLEPPVAVHAVDAERAWVFGEGGTITKIADGRVASVDTSLYEADEPIEIAIGRTVDPLGEKTVELWLASQRALFVSDQGARPREVVVWDRPDRPVALACTENGTLWVASRTELCRVASGRIEVALHLDVGPREQGFAGLACGPDASLWAASTSRGIVHLDGGRVEWLAPPAARRPGAGRVAIFVPDAGRAYFALPTGACAVDRHGLPAQVAYAEGLPGDKQDEIFLAFVDELMAAVGGFAPRHQLELSRRLF